MAKGYRGIEDTHGLLKKLSNGGELHGVTEKVKGENDYWLGIRDNKVMIYYLGGKILEISSTGLLDFNSKYISHYDESLEINKRFSNIGDWLSKEKLLRSAILNYQTKFTKKEKMAQQEIMIQNNRKEDSEWFLVDMEYSVSGISYGRFDVIAISRKKNANGKHRIALIELKTGANSFSGTKAEDDETGEITIIKKYGSGIAGHINNFYEFLFSKDGTENVKRLAKEISMILSNYRILGLNNGTLQIEVEDIDISPQNVECIIMCTDIKNRAYGVEQAKKYIFDFKTASKYCLEKLWGEHFVEKLNKLNIFLSIVDKERVVDRGTFEKIKK